MTISQIPPARQPRRAGFSLTEVLIVIGLIVLMIALAVPTINFISGNRSVDGAQNNIAALLGRARAEAIGLQEVRGVFFFAERATGKITLALVRDVDAPAASTFTRPGTVSASEPRPEVWLDLVPDADFVTLPPGVMLQTVDDALTDGAGNRVEDGYIGFNRRNMGNATNPASPASDTHTLYGGVILFDGTGQMISRRYAFKTFYVDSSNNRQPTRMGDLLYRPKGDPSPLMNHYSTINDVVPLATFPAIAGAGSDYYPKSQLGVVLFDRETWRSQFPPIASPPYEPDYDWQFEPRGTANTYIGTPTREDLEEKWIDDNGLPLMVNRYNGTLVRGE